MVSYLSIKSHSTCLILFNKKKKKNYWDWWCWMLRLENQAFSIIFSNVAFKATLAFFFFSKKTATLALKSISEKVYFLTSLAEKLWFEFCADTFLCNCKSDKSPNNELTKKINNDTVEPWATTIGCWPKKDTLWTAFSFEKDFSNH